MTFLIGIGTETLINHKIGAERRALHVSLLAAQIKCCRKLSVDIFNKNMYINTVHI